MADPQAKSDLYAKAVEQASLTDIMLTASTFAVSHEFHDFYEGAQKFVDQSLVEEPHYDTEQGLLVGAVRCRVWMNKGDYDLAEDEDDGAFHAAIFAVEATYGVVFVIPGEHDDETIRTFFERMAPFATWPYFRTHLAQTASAAGLEIPILPIKKLFHPVKAAGGYTDSNPVPQIESDGEESPN